MKQIASLLPKLPPSKRGSERGDLLQFFTDTLNHTRDGKKFKKLSVAAVAVKLSHLNLSDLYYLRSVCDDAQRRGFSFSKRFWWEIKPKQDV